MPNRWREILSDGSAVRLSFRTLLAGKVEVNGFEFLVFQSISGSDLIHLLVESLLTLGCALVGFMVKRAVERRDTERKERTAEIAAIRHELACALERVAALEGVMGLTAAPHDRP